MTDCTVVLYLLYIGWMLLDGGRGGTDIHTDIQTDQPTRLQEFHILYGTNNNAWSPDY